MTLAATDAPQKRSLAERLGGLWQLLGGVNIRTKILGIVVTLTAILGLGITWRVRLVMDRVLVSELDNRGGSVVSDLAARSIDPILLNDTYGLYELLAHTIDNHPDAVYAFVVAEDGRVLAHTFGDAGFPTALLTLHEPISAAEPSRLTYRSSQGQIHDFAMAIFDGRAGIIRLGLAEDRLHTIVNGVTAQMLLTTLLVALAGIAAAFALTWLLTRPILDLVTATNRIGAGDLTARAPSWADDEIGALAAAFNRMVTDLELSRQTIAQKDAARGLLLEQLISAQEEERKLVSRELHDGVGQALASLILEINLSARQEDLTIIRENRVRLRDAVLDILKQVRMLSRQLRPSVLDDLGLAAALQRYAAEFRDRYPNMSVDLHCDLSERLPQSVEISLYRVVQEAMTNAARHSRGNILSVVIGRRDGRVQAIVEDDGQGFHVAAAQQAGDSVGLHSMAERIQLLGGTLEIESGNDGTTIFAEVPLE